MEKKQIQESLAFLKANSPKRNFKQSVDLILNLKDINLKNPEEAVNMFITLHNETGKKISVCALVGPELKEKAAAVCDEVVLLSEFEKFKGKKEMKQLADRHDFFIAQANLMAQIATTFGRVFGPRGKMPNPKIGAVVPPNANLEPLVAKLKKTINLQTKNDATVRCMVGKEDLDEAALLDNIQFVYASVLHKLPNEQNNIKSIMLKYTMGKPVVIGKDPSEESQEEEASAKATGETSAEESNKVLVEGNKEEIPAKAEKEE